MEWPFKVQGRMLHKSDVEEIRRLQRKHPDWGRSRISVAVCDLWNWRRPDGQLKDIACRELLRKLETHGFLILPPRQSSGPKNLPIIADIEVDRSIIDLPLCAVNPIELVNARSCSEEEKLFNYLLKTYHYLSFSRPVGQNMKYLIRSADGLVLGCLLFGAAAWKCADRDRFIGWSATKRQANVNLLTNNTRFLILPWVHIKYLASHVLSQVVQRLSADWLKRYGSKYLKRINVKDAASITFCADGGNGIWERIDPLAKSLDSSTVHRVLDYTHAKQNLTPIVDLLHQGRGIWDYEYEKVTTQVKELLWQGRIKDIELLICERLHRKRQKRKALKKLNDYFGDHEKFQYRKYQAMGIPIGSGTIESAIRRVINLRIKAPGQFWLLENAEKMIFLRSQVLTGRWHSVLDKALRRRRNNFYDKYLKQNKMAA